MNETKKEKTSIQVFKIDRDIAKRMMPRWRTENFCQFFHKLLHDRLQETQDKKVREYARTQDLELAEKYDCIYRVPFEGRLLCCRSRAEVPRFLKTVKQCGACDKRLSSFEAFRRKLDIAEKKPFVFSKELNIRDFRASKEHIRLQIEGNSYFWTCEPEQRYTEKGYEVKSEKCPQKVLLQSGNSEGWHPVEICKWAECSFLKPLEKVIKEKI